MKPMIIALEICFIACSIIIIVFWFKYPKNSYFPILLAAFAVFSATTEIIRRSQILDKSNNKELPILNYGINSLPSQYENGQIVEGIEWRQNYSQHLITIVNESDENLLNTIISIHLPAGIVKSKIESSVNVFNVNLSSFNKPMTIGKTKIEETFSNSLDISIEKMNKHSTLTIGLVLDYRFKPKEWWNNAQGYWQFDISYEYEKRKDEVVRNRIINPVKILKEEPLSIFVDKELNFVNKDSIKATHDTYPFSPLISKPDGSFIQIEDFNGSFENIKLGKGEGLINSMGYDYEVNTDMNYK